MQQISQQIIRHCGFLSIVKNTHPKHRTILPLLGIHFILSFEFAFLCYLLFACLRRAANFDQREFQYPNVNVPGFFFTRQLLIVSMFFFCLFCPALSTSTIPIQLKRKCYKILFLGNCVTSTLYCANGRPPFVVQRPYKANVLLVIFIAIYCSSIVGCACVGR